MLAHPSHSQGTAPAAAPTCVLALSFLLSLPATAAEAPVSWFKDITPIFKRSCNGCHNPNKTKGGVDTSTYALFARPGKNGPNYVPGDPGKSIVLTEVTGKEPSMPKEGDPLSAAEVALLERWIREGARDDTPADAYSTRLTAPPSYPALPVITALAISPDGQWLAASGYHEVLVFSTADFQPRGRWVGESTRIESLAFSPDSRHLAVAAGVPASLGEVQVWEVGSGRQAAAWKVAADSVYGISWSPAGDRIAVGGADKSVRILAWPDGKEVVRFDNHSDWSLQTAWLPGGTRLLSGSRDRAIKLIDAASGQFIDDINKLIEPVTAIARHPREESVLYGGAEGGLRIYRAKENQERTAANNDVNLVREFERQPGSIQAVAMHPEGSRIAVAPPNGEVRLYATTDGKRLATLGGHDGAVFSLAFNPDGSRLYTGAYDGLIREFDPASGRLTGILQPVPLARP